MKVIVDSSVWSEALRLRTGRPSDAALEVHNLIDDHRVIMLGPIRQELLSGIKDPAAFEGMRTSLRAFPDQTISREHYEQAAGFYNLCKSKGVTGASVDLLIAAVAMAEDFAVFTRDRDFEHLRRILPLRLHVPAAR